MAKEKKEAPRAQILNVQVAEVPADAEGKRRNSKVRMVDVDMVITTDRKFIGHDPKNHIGMLLRTMVLSSLQGATSSVKAKWSADCFGKGEGGFNLSQATGFDYTVRFASEGYTEEEDLEDDDDEELVDEVDDQDAEDDEELEDDDAPESLGSNDLDELDEDEGVDEAWEG